MTVGEDHYFLFRIFPFSKGNTPEGMKYYSHLKMRRPTFGVGKSKPSNCDVHTDIKDP